MNAYLLHQNGSKSDSLGCQFQGLVVPLVHLPPDILYIIFHVFLEDKSDDISVTPSRRYDRENCSDSRLIPLSQTCKYMCAQTRLWIFRQVYNWSRKGSDVWPEALWPFIV
jgi:hypothetical protein